MSEAVIAAIITGVLTLVGTVITVLASNKKTDENLKVSQAVINTKIEELTREVRAHNNFAQRMPVVENKIENLELRISKMEDDGK